MNGKHSYQDKFKPYEIVSENRDPILGPNSPDAPAGFSRVQRRKWKLWINTLTGKMFTRKSKYENEWKEVEGGGSCPENIVPFNNHVVVARRKPSGLSFVGWDYSNMTQPLTFPVSVAIYIGDNNSTGYVNTINSNDINDFLNQVYQNIIDFQNGWSGDTSMTFQVASFGTGFYIESTNPSYNGGMQINFRDGNTGFWYNEVQDNEQDGIDGRLMYPFVLGETEIGPCELVELPVGGCPNTQVEYDNHYFIGRNATVTPGETIYGWDLTAFLPFMNQNVVMWFGEQNQVGITSVEQAYNSLQAIADYFQQSWLDINYPAGYVLSIQGNILVLSWNGVGTDPYGISTFLFGAHDHISTNFILPNDVDGAYSFIDEISTPGTETLGECEVVKVNEGTFDCAVDEVFFTKPSQTVILDGKYQGWSYPEGVQWSNVPQRDNRSWIVFFDNLDTDGIGSVSTTPVTQAFASFNDLVAEINNQLITYGSSYRVVAIGNDRLLVADNNYNILLAGDPYFTAHAFNIFSLIIEDSVTNSDWLIKGRNPKSLGLTNVTHQIGLGGIYKGTIGCGGISSLPVPKVMIDNEKTGQIFDQSGAILYTVLSPVVVSTQDLTQAQLDAGVKLEFMYYRSAKSRISSSRSWKAGFVHPAHTDISQDAVYNDGTRGGDHNGVAMYRPSEFDVTMNGQTLPAFHALNSRLRHGPVSYRDVSGTQLTIDCPYPVRMQQKLGNFNNVGHKKAYSTRFRPLYFAFRYAIRQSDGTWISGPMSKTFMITTLIHPFRFNAVASDVQGVPVCDIDINYDPQVLKIYQAPHKL